MATADGRMLVDPAPSIGHTSNLGVHVVLDSTTIHPGELPVRTLVVRPALGRHELAFQHDLGVSRYEDIIVSHFTSFAGCP
jgi:hypothetical protein